MKDIDEVLKSYIGKEIELSIIIVETGRSVYTTGKLLAFNKNLISLELEEEKGRLFKKKKKAKYHLNRHASYLLSIVSDE